MRDGVRIEKTVNNSTRERGLEDNESFILRDRGRPIHGARAVHTRQVDTGEGGRGAVHARQVCSGEEGEGLGWVLADVQAGWSAGGHRSG